jgi:diaminopimelate epimerase
MNMDYQVFTIASGNATGIIQFKDSSRRSEYPQIAESIMSKDAKLEQFGFLEGANYFQMSGGEFCGNAALAAVLLIHKQTGQTTGEFITAGFQGNVEFSILLDGKVKCNFSGLEMKIKSKQLANGLDGHLVDLDGITHFVLKPSFTFENNPEVYKKIHTQIIEEIGLQDKPAVGVIWQEDKNNEIKIHPIVWVKNINSFFYETACGSGTLAVLAANAQNKLSVTQPSGGVIEAEKTKDGYSLTAIVMHT